MRHNAIKTYDNKTAVTTDQITRVSLTRPAGVANLHLQLQYSQVGDFSDAVEAILTSVEADRGKVRFFDGEASAAFPAEGLSDDYAGQRVVVDLSAVPLQVWLRYRWYAASGEPSGAWRGLYHPSSGGVEEVVSAVQANGALVVSLTGTTAGRWSVDNGVTWHESGTTLTLAPGSYTVTYQPVAGYVTPAPAAATIVAGQVTTIAGDYVADVYNPYADWGYLQVTLTGTDAGRWTIDSGDTWHESGVTLYVLTGPYGVQFEPVNGYTTPIERIVTVSADQTTSVSAGYVAVDVSHDPTDYGMVWDNGTEPTLGEGNKVIFVTPTGAGNFSGDSWANAKAGLYTAGLAASNGDVLYLQEGTYTSHLAPVAATKSIGIYGGFTVADGTWATRDGFANPTTIDATSNPSVPFIKPESGVTQVVDGISCTGFAGGVMLANGGTATVKNCAIYDCEGLVSSHAVENCLVLNCTGGTGAATDCVFVNVDMSVGSIIGGNATDCIFLNCSASTIIYGAATGCTLENCETRGLNGCVKDNAEDCTFTNCNSNIIGTGYISCIVYGDATNCTFTNCSSSSSYINYSYIVGTTATNCTFTNCGCSSSSSYIVGTTATNCTFTNCTSTGSSVYSGIVGTTATNCTISRCVASRLTGTTSGYKVTNSVIWNSTITELAFGAGTNNAATAYIDANTLVLGTDNTLANFVSIGTVETIGYSASLNSTPAEDFGDFRPLVGSILIGAGIAVDGVTTDITGATRANPPTIGAYEYQAAE